MRYEVIAWSRETDGYVICVERTPNFLDRLFGFDGSRHLFYRADAELSVILFGSNEEENDPKIRKAIRKALPGIRFRFPS